MLLSLQLWVASVSASRSSDFPCFPDLSHPSFMAPSERVFWTGPYFGRLIKSGKDYLERRGWNKLYGTEQDCLAQLEASKGRLAFVWPSKSGPQFEIADSGAAHIRPYPTHATDIVDDKVRLARLLDGHKSNIIPKHIASPEDASSDAGKLFYVKHRYGAQGKSVYVYNKEELQNWWCRSRNSQDFVIQEEVLPALYEGKKFVLRSHILVAQRDCLGLRAYLHNTVICQQHSTSYFQHDHENQSKEKMKSSHISQAGKRHPPPVLLKDLARNHPAADALPKIEVCSKVLVVAAFPNDSENVLSMSNDTTCFALLGTDLLVDVDGNVILCEVNSHPALGWGTMAKVPSTVFTQLIHDTLTVLIGGDHESTGFRQLI